MCTHVININNLFHRNLYTHPNIYILRQNLHGFYHLPLQNQEKKKSIHQYTCIMGQDVF